MKNSRKSDKLRPLPEPKELFPGRLGERIRHALAGSGSSIQEIAVKLGVTPSAIYNWVSETNAPSLEKLVALAHATRTSVGWLVAAEGEIRPNHPGGYIKPAFRTDLPPLAFESGWVERSIGPLAGEFPRELRTSLKKPHEELPLLLVEVPDDAMEPTLRKGDLLLAPLFEKGGMHVNGLYLVATTQSAEVGARSCFPRRVEWTSKPSVVLKCDNPAYPLAMELTDAKKDGLLILARVVWHARLI